MIESLSSPAEHGIAAGAFDDWLQRFRASLRSDEGTDVPCGDCDGCCVSSYAILVRPGDRNALSVIPADLLVDASALGPGIRAMGHLPDGTCPMLRAGRCSIYVHRPQTCRDYDCRIFAAAGIPAGGPGKSVINRRVRAWRFGYPTETDRLAHQAVRTAAAFIERHGAGFPDGRFPAKPSGIAVLAVKTYTVFLDGDTQGRSATAIAAAILDAAREFDAG